jgi:hypothetical protein
MQQMLRQPVNQMQFVGQDDVQWQRHCVTVRTKRVSAIGIHQVTGDDEMRAQCVRKWRDGRTDGHPW